MRSFNRTTLIGNVGGDAVMRHTSSGTAVVNLSLATNSRRKDDSPITTWHRIVLWGRLAEIAQKYIRKGQSIYVEGPTHQREWTDSAGVQHSTTEVTARELILLGGHRSAAGNLNEAQGSRSAEGEEGQEIFTEISF
ncbi:MAG: single-stranded DNA-binding protein [Rickettsiales bacterium]|nr:single-stranded DNA-binding protein [Rickettsiales bacterium]MBJ96203.1 single-stranded DNA-binding protein [Rickettsiales bacterium]|tara:strand:+ start:876 stop:1286 length:411 start_codon:yes stop_codon:yes gene_type:complete